MESVKQMFVTITMLFTTTQRIINTIDASAEMLELTACDARDALKLEKADARHALKLKLAAAKAKRTTK